jgi:hypothetical protein
MLSFFERRAEDSAAGRKNAGPSGRNAAFLRGGLRTVQLEGGMR